MFQAKSEPNTGPSVNPLTAEIIRLVEAIKSELRCGICCSTLNNPVITTCNHLFCKSCFTECMKQLKALNCPMCMQKLHRRSCTECDSYSTLVSHYLQMAKAFTRDLQPLDLRPADNFLESQAVVVAGSVPSPLRNFQPEPLFAIPALPSRRSKGKRPANAPLPVGRLKQAKLEVIGEEDEGPSTSEVKDNSIETPLSRVKEERKSAEPQPARTSSRMRRSKSKSQDDDKTPPPQIRRSSRGKSQDEDNIDIVDVPPPVPVPLVPYTQSSTGTSVVGPTQLSQPCEDREMQTESIDKMDSCVQTEQVTLIHEIQSERASTSSIESDLSILLKIHPELMNILKSNRDELNRLLFPFDTVTPRGKMRLSDVLNKCFATPTGYTDDESEQGCYTKEKKDEIDESSTTRPMYYNEEDEKIMNEERNEREEEKEKKEEEEDDNDSDDGDGSVQAERGDDIQIHPNEEEEEEVIDTSSENDEKEDTVAGTPSPHGIIDNEDKEEYDNEVHERFVAEESHNRSIKVSQTEHKDPITTVEVFEPIDNEVDSFNDSIIFNTLQPFAEINPITMQRSPSKKSPNKMMKTESSLKNQKDSFDFDEDSESQTNLIISVTGVTSRENEDLLAEFRAIFGQTVYKNRVEESNHVVVLDSINREIRCPSVQIASAHSSKCMLLCREWMERSIAKKKLLDTASYGILSGQKGQVAAWQRAKMEPPLFNGFTFLLPNTFSHSKALPRDRLCTLITNCGGKIVDRPWKLPRNKSAVVAGAPIQNVHTMTSFIIFAPSSRDYDSASRFEKDTTVPVFTADWIIDSISSYSIIITDTDEYRVSRH